MDLKLILSSPAGKAWPKKECIYGRGRGKLHGTIEFEISHHPGGRYAPGPAIGPNIYGPGTGGGEAPAPARAGQLSGNFVHLAPDGSKHDFTRADNRLIRKARKAGQDSVDVSDVRLPNGMVLNFEVGISLLCSPAPRLPRTAAVAGSVQAAVGQADERALLRALPSEQGQPEHARRGGEAGGVRSPLRR